MMIDHHVMIYLFFLSRKDEDDRPSRDDLFIFFSPGKMKMTDHHMVIENTCGPDEGTYTAVLDYSNERQEVNFNLQVLSKSGLDLFDYNTIDQ
jgi:hypothetical protein